MWLVLYGDEHLLFFFRFCFGVGDGESGAPESFAVGSHAWASTRGINGLVFISGTPGTHLFASGSLLGAFAGTTNVVVDVAVLLSTVSFGLAVFCWFDNAVSVVLTAAVAVVVLRGSGVVLPAGAREINSRQRKKPVLVKVLYP